MARIYRRIVIAVKVAGLVGAGVRGNGPA